MFYGLPYSQALCCAFCLTPAPDFRGSYWGVVGNVFTRMAEYIKHPDMLQPPVAPYYPYPHRKPHPTLQATLPNLTDEDDIERECFGAACAMITDGSALSSGGGSEYVWLWLHYVPVGETNLDNAVAAFGRVKVSDYVEGQYTAAVGEPAVWLVNDENGDPRVWNDVEYLDYWSPHRKAFVGPGYVGWIDKRISSGTENRITYHTVSQSTPSVLTWPNTAQTISAGLYYNVADVSRSSFPLALGCWSDENLFTDTTRQNVTRAWNIGEINLANGRLSKPDTVDEDDWDLTVPPFPIGIEGCSVNGASGATRFDENAPIGSDAHFSVVVIDWVVAGSQWIDGVPPDDVTKFSLWDMAILNYADPFDFDDDVDGLASWYQHLHSFGDPTTLADTTGPVPSGTDDYPQYLVSEEGPGPDDDIYADWGYMRLFEYYASHNQYTSNPFSPAFGCHYRPASESYDSIGFRTGIIENEDVLEQEGRATPDPDVADFYDNIAGEFNSIRVEGVIADPNLANFNCVRVPRKLSGGSTSPPRYYLVGNLGVFGFTWPEKDSTSDGDERVPVTFYDSSGPDAGAAVIDPPSGFWKDTEGDLHRGNFAIQGQYDDHHPSATTLYDLEDTDYTDDGPTYP